MTDRVLNRRKVSMTLPLTLERLKYLLDTSKVNIETDFWLKSRLINYLQINVFFSYQNFLRINKACKF